MVLSCLNFNSLRLPCGIYISTFNFKAFATLMGKYTINFENHTPGIAAILGSITCTPEYAKCSHISSFNKVYEIVANVNRNTNKQHIRLLFVAH